MSESVSPARLAALGGSLEGLEPDCLERLAAVLRPTTLEEGDSLFAEGDAVDAVYVVLDGQLRSFRAEAGRELSLGTITPGEIVGEFMILAGGARSTAVSAVSRAELARCSRRTFIELCQRFSSLRDLTVRVGRDRRHRNRLTAALVGALGDLSEASIRYVAEGSGEIHLRRGEILFRQGEPADGMYVLMTGRLQLQVDEDGSSSVLGEIAKGDVVGEMSLLSEQAERSATAVALRDSDLVKITRSQFDHLAESHPDMLRSMLGFLSDRMRDRNAGRLRRGKIRNIAVVPIDAAVDIDDFTTRFVRSLAEIASAVHVGSRSIEEHFAAAHAADVTFGHDEYVRLVGYLEEQEAAHEFVVYQADPLPTPWTKRSVRQADVTLLVASSSSAPVPGETETALFRGDNGWDTARRVLVLLHPNGDRLPEGTMAWLEAREVHQHYHVRLDRATDFARIARIETGRGVGLVLSGGGARCAGHFGALDALAEAEIPIDIVGGTSGGGQVALQYAMGKTPTEILENAKQIAAQRIFRAFTAPLISLLSPTRAYALARLSAGTAKIEDLWLTCYCVSFNLSTGEKRIHTTGSVAKAIMATGAIPAAFPPVVEGDSLLVDGGVIDNVPVGVMREYGPSRVISCNVSPGVTLSVTPPDQPLPSGWRVLWSRLNPFARRLDVPSLLELVMRMVAINDSRTRSDARKATDLLLEPPVQRFGLMQFDRLEEISQVAYEYTRKQFATKRKSTLGLDRPEPREEPGRDSRPGLLT